MKKHLLIALVAVAIVASSCKNKSTAKTLEGTWNEVKVNGTDVPVGVQDQMVFGKCGGGKNKECDLTIIDGGSSVTDNLFYTVKDGGETLVIIQYVGLVKTSIFNTITNITDNSLTIEWSSQFIGYTGEYTKQ